MESEPGSPAIRAFSGDSNASGSPLLRPTDGDSSKLGQEAPPVKIPLGERGWGIGLEQGLQGWHGSCGRGAGSRLEFAARSRPWRGQGLTCGLEGVLQSPCRCQGGGGGEGGWGGGGKRVSRMSRPCW